MRPSRAEMHVVSPAMADRILQAGQSPRRRSRFLPVTSPTSASPAVTPEASATDTVRSSGRGFVVTSDKDGAKRTRREGSVGIPVTTVSTRPEEPAPLEAIAASAQDVDASAAADAAPTPGRFLSRRAERRRMAGGTAVAVLEPDHVTGDAGDKRADVSDARIARRGMPEVSDDRPEEGRGEPLSVDSEAVARLQAEVAEYLAQNPDQFVRIDLPADALSGRSHQAPEQTEGHEEKSEGRDHAPSAEQASNPLLADLLAFARDEVTQNGNLDAVSITVDEHGTLLVGGDPWSPDVDAEEGAVTSGEAPEATKVDAFRKGRRPQGDGSDGAGANGDSGAGDSDVPGGPGNGEGNGANPPGNPPGNGGDPPYPGDMPRPEYGEDPSRYVVLDYQPFILPTTLDMTSGERTRLWLATKGHNTADRAYRRFKTPLTDAEVEALEDRKKAVEETRKEGQPSWIKRAGPNITHAVTVGVGESASGLINSLPHQYQPLGILLYGTEGIVSIFMYGASIKKNFVTDKMPQTQLATWATNLLGVSVSSFASMIAPGSEVAIGSTAFIGTAGAAEGVWGGKIMWRNGGDNRAVRKYKRHVRQEQKEAKGKSGTSKRKSLESSRKNYEIEFNKLRAKHDQILVDLKYGQGPVFMLQEDAEATVRKLKALTKEMIKVRLKANGYAIKESRRKELISPDINKMA